MITESIFEIGTSHEVCEDYAVHGDGYTIISDGCSNGGGPRIDTDWGSRILCKAAEANLYILRTHPSEGPTEFMTATGITANTQLKIFENMHKDCLTATLSVLYAQHDLFKGLLIGDGIFGGLRKDGRWKIYVVDFIKGGSSGKSAPFYLKYNFCNEVESYVDMFGGKYEVTMYFGDLMSDSMEFPIPEHSTEAERDDQWAQAMSATSKEYDLGEGFHEFEFPTKDYEFVFHCSDGPQAFSRYETTGSSKSKEPVHVLDVLRVLMDIPPANKPGFLMRQRHWAFRQTRLGTFKSRGWFGEDDVSVGVIYNGK